MSGLYTISALSQPLRGRVRIHAEGEGKDLSGYARARGRMCVRTGTRFYLSTKGEGDCRFKLNSTTPFPRSISTNLFRRKAQIRPSLRKEWGDQPFSLGLRLETESRGLVGL